MKIDFKKNKIIRFDENKIEKEHFPLSTFFKEIEVLSDGRIIICEDSRNFEFNGKSNIYCLSRLLEIDWFLPFANPAFSNDYYVGFTTNGEIIFANSWNGFRVEVDTATGGIKNIEFLK